MPWRLTREPPSVSVRPLSRTARELAARARVTRARMRRWFGDSRAARARQRALELGLVPNEELTSLPLNVPDETVEDSLSEVDTDEADGRRIARARLNAMKVNAEASIARKPLSQSEIAAFDLIDGVPGRSLKRWILGLRLHAMIVLQ